MAAARRVACCARRAIVAAPALLAAAQGAAAGAWREDFASGRLDPQRWQRTLDGDFRTHAAEVVAGEAGYRLRLARRYRRHAR